MCLSDSDFRRFALLPRRIGMSSKQRPNHGSDIADCEHVPDGPGVMLIGHEGSVCQIWYSGDVNEEDKPTASAVRPGLVRVDEDESRQEEANRGERLEGRDR